MKRFKLKVLRDDNGNYHVINECDGGVPAGTISVTPANSVGAGNIAGYDKALGKGKKPLKRKSIIMDNKSGEM